MSTMTKKQTQAAQVLKTYLDAKDYGTASIHTDIHPDAPVVAWDGPFEWAPKLTGGENMFFEEWYHEAKSLGIDPGKVTTDSFVKFLEREYDVCWECQKSYSTAISPARNASA